MKPALLILAAGLGSRYGSLKQIEPVGPDGEAIVDYSVFDALRAGFGKVVFIIKREIETDFKDNLLKRFEDRIETDYVFQELDRLPEGYSLPPGRKKPWGTAHAVMMAEGVVDTPFCVINADDFYGFEAYREMAQFLVSGSRETDYAMVGYKLENTLSDHGSVSRGICRMDAAHYLRSVTERTDIRKEGEQIVYYENDTSYNLSKEATVSMNMWGFTPPVIEQIKEKFLLFLDKNKDHPTAECYIPEVIDELIHEGKARVKVLQCDASWFGITYRQDREKVRRCIRQKIENGEYPHKLWS